MVTAWAAITLNFLIPRFMPGNPVELLISHFKGRMSPAAVRSLGALFGLSHQSMFSQYATYWSDLLHGDLGTSFTYFPSSVTSIVLAALPWTLVLVGVATIRSVSCSVPWRVVIVGARRGSWLDITLPISTFFSAIPYFWFALVILYFFAIVVHWFPLSGGYGAVDVIGWNWPFLWSAAYHSILPAITIIVTSIAGWLLGMRNMMIVTLDEDYIILAEAKGLSKTRINFLYAARNAILPSLASFALSLGFVVSGAILVEIVFSYPGIGYVLFAAVNNDDYPLMQGVFLIITLAVLLANIVADVFYVLLDPRTRRGSLRWLASQRLVRAGLSGRDSPGSIRGRSSAGLGIVGFFVLMAILGPLFVRYNPSAMGTAIDRTPVERALGWARRSPVRTSSLNWSMGVARRSSSLSYPPPSPRSCPLRWDSPAGTSAERATSSCRCFRTSSWRFRRCRSSSSSPRYLPNKGDISVMLVIALSRAGRGGPGSFEPRRCPFVDVTSWKPRAQSVRVRREFCSGRNHAQENGDRYRQFPLHRDLSRIDGGGTRVPRSGQRLGVVVGDDVVLGPERLGPPVRCVVVVRAARPVHRVAWHGTFVDELRLR